MTRTPPPSTAPAPQAPPAPSAPAPDAPVSPENKPAPAPRATLGAALALARGTAAPGGASSAPAPAEAPPAAPPEPQAWQRIAAAKFLDLIFAANDRLMEKRHREPMEDAPEKGDDEFDAATESLSVQLAIWCPATALPPWGQAAIITAGMLGDRWIMSKPVEDDDAAKTAGARPAAATAAGTRPAPPPPPTNPDVNASPMGAEAG